MYSLDILKNISTYTDTAKNSLLSTKIHLFPVHSLILSPGNGFLHIMVMLMKRLSVCQLTMCSNQCTTVCVYEVLVIFLKHYSCIRILYHSLYVLKTDLNSKTSHQKQTKKKKRDSSILNNNQIYCGGKAMT